jgi:hypothetical protein
MFTVNPAEYPSVGDTMGTRSLSRPSEFPRRTTTIPLCSLLSQTRLDNLNVGMHDASGASNFEYAAGKASLSLTAHVREDAKVFTNV